jgi:hypothetical protein
MKIKEGMCFFCENKKIHYAVLMGKPKDQYLMPVCVDCPKFVRDFELYKQSGHILCVMEPTTVTPV